MDPPTARSVASRARTENFPVASLLFPRALRPHLRAIYGFARLVDMLGDEVPRATGSRRSTSSRRELEACYGGEPAWEVMRELQPTIRACSLPREPFLRLIEANRMDQRSLGVRDVARPEGLLRPLGRPRRPARARRARARRRRRGGRALATTSAPASSSSTSSRTCRVTSRLGRVYLPAEDRRRFGVDGARPAEPRAAAAARVRGRAGARPARVRRGARPAARRRPRRAGGRRSSRAAASRRSRRSSAPTGTSSHGRPRPSRARLRPGGARDERRRCLR